MHIVMLILMLQQTTKNSKIPSTTNRDLSKLCGAETSECEDKIKEDVQATSRCMPFEQEHLS